MLNKSKDQVNEQSKLADKMKDGLNLSKEQMEKQKQDIKNAISEKQKSN